MIAKHNDTNNTANFDTTGSVILLNGIANGYTTTTRIGREITMSSLEFLGTVLPSNNATDITQCRLILCLDMQPNGSLPVITDLLETSSPTSHINWDNTDRFKFLWDELFVMGGNYGVVKQQLNVPSLHTVSPCLDLDIDAAYGGTSNGIADITSNSLLLVTLGDKAPLDGGIYSFGSRLIFFDK